MGIGRILTTAMNVLSLLLIGAGFALIATFFTGSPFPSSVASSVPAGEVASAGPGAGVPDLAKEGAEEQARQTQRQVERFGGEGRDATVPAPEDRRLWMTIPEMSRVKNAPIPYASGTDEEALRNHVAIHLRGTGFPWEREANVYIAGHRLGYLGTGSFLAFYDLNKLEEGDVIHLSDARDRRYTYRVFKRMVVDPTDIFVTRPLEGRNIVTLQTCTLPDYSQRLIVRAERVA